MKKSDLKLEPQVAASMLLGEFVGRLVSCPESPPRTVALEQQIRIGTGFHEKWYRSQREHWLGTLGYLLEKDATAGDSPAKRQWTHTHCFPMLFWVAECSGVDHTALQRAEVAAYEAAALMGHDHPSHGKAARSVLPWTLVESALREHVPVASQAEASLAVSEAYRYLASKDRTYRPPKGSSGR